MFRNFVDICPLPSFFSKKEMEHHPLGEGGGVGGVPPRRGSY